MATVINKANNTTPVDKTLEFNVIRNIVSLTQAQYNALAVKDANTLYLIVG